MLSLQKKLNQVDPQNPIVPPVLEQWLQWHCLPPKKEAEDDEPKKKRKITGVSFAGKKGARPEGYLFSFDVIFRSLVAVNCEAIVCNSHLGFSADVPGVRSGCAFVDMEGISLNEEKNQIEIKEVEGGKFSFRVVGETDVEVIFDRLQKVWVEAMWGYHAKLVGKDQVILILIFLLLFLFM